MHLENPSGALDNDRHKIDRKLLSDRNTLSQKIEHFAQKGAWWNDRLKLFFNLTESQFDPIVFGLREINDQQFWNWCPLEISSLALKGAGAKDVRHSGQRMNQSFQVKLKMKTF